MTPDPISAMQRLINDLRSDAPIGNDYAEACMAYFDYQRTPMQYWSPAESMRLYDRAFSNARRNHTTTPAPTGAAGDPSQPDGAT